MNISQIISLIKTFIPVDSPWLQRIDKAAELAKSYSPNKDGVSQLMEAYGKNRDDLQKAVGMLENPIIKNALSRIPGLGQILNNAANDLMSDPNIGSNYSSDNKNYGSSNSQDSSFDSLQSRLKRLK